MKEPEPHDRLKFVELARTLEADRLLKQEEWNQKNQAWVKEYGPIPFQVQKLFFDGK
ncbi:MAG: hypothetical protein HY914_20170 [Desulfomonile tiedjei]|nr:hypothetical protein [Desulfomonile tiedjei]